MSRKALLWTSGVVVLALIAGAVAFVVLRPGDPAVLVEHRFTVGGTEIVLDTSPDDDVTATPVDDGRPEISGVRVLADPVHLDADGGLSAPAVLSFVIAPGVLPPAVDPEAWLGILVRGERTGGRWTWVGGHYDSETRRLSVETEQLSDWTYGVTNFDQIEADLAQARGQNGAGMWLARTAWGDIPALQCSSDGTTALTYEVRDETLPPIQVCFTLNRDQNVYHLEIVNTHSYPFALKLPAGLRAHPEFLQGMGLAGDVFAAWYGAQGPGRVILPAEAKLEFSAKKGDLAPGAEITGTPDWPYLMLDVGSLVLDLSLTEFVADSDEFKDTSVILREQYGSLIDVKGYEDCIVDQLGAIQNSIKAQDKDATGKVLELIQEGLKNCADQLTAALGKAIDAAHKKKYGITSKITSKVKWLAGKVTGTGKWLGRRFTALLSLDDIMKGVREYANLVMANAFGALASANGQQLNLDIAVRLSARADPLAAVPWDRVVAPCEPPTTLAIEQVLSHDLTGDEVLDAVVHTACKAQKEEAHRIEIFDGASSPSAPRRLATLPLEDTDRWKTSFYDAHVTITEPATITIHATGQSPGTSNAEGRDLLIRDEYRWVDGRFRRTANEVTRCSTGYPDVTKRACVPTR